MDRCLTVIISTSLVFGTIQTTKAQSPAEPMGEIISACGATTEINYYSQKLQSPQGDTTVYLDNVIRRIAVDGEQLIDNSYCSEYGNGSTPVRRMIIETSNGTRTMELEPSNSVYVIDNPVSFSPDGRYVAVKSQYAIPGSDGGIGLFIVDIEQQESEQVIDVCEKTRNPQEPYYVGEFKGFISETEVMTMCMGGSMGLEQPWTEVLDLATGAASKVSSSEGGNIYGEPTEPVTIVKKQEF